MRCWSPRPVHALAKSEVVRTATLNRIMARWLADPHPHDAPDRKAMATGWVSFRDGRALGIFQRRTGDRGK